MSPSLRQRIKFDSLDDVYDEIERLYDEAKDKGFDLGESLYTQVPFFTDIYLLVQQKYQDRIKEYNFCKTFSCPPSQSLDKTPAHIIDDFIILDQEFNNYSNKEKPNA